MAHTNCIFALTQIAQDFACEHGELVARRGGPDIDCSSASAREHCELVHQHLKQVGLVAFEYEDDLTQVPHGVWAKIQFGGLLGLQRLLNQDANDGIDNIAALLVSAAKQYEDLNQLPYEDFVPAMRSYRLKRRRSR